MRYRMRLVSDEGKLYFFEGHKDVRARGAGHAWSEMTTLYTTIGAGPDGGSEPGTGILHLKPADFTQAGAQHQGRRTSRAGSRASTAGRSWSCSPTRWCTSTAACWTSRAPSRARRERRRRSASPGDPDGIWWCDSRRQWHADDRLGDDAFLRLTRYRAGDKGPVMLATGFGMSSHSFLAPTIEQNLTEFLAACGLRRLAVRLPGRHRPALGRHRVHHRRHRPRRLAGRGAARSWRRPAATTCRPSATASARSRCRWRSWPGCRASAPRSARSSRCTRPRSVFNMVKSRMHTADVLGAARGRAAGARHPPVAARRGARHRPAGPPDAGRGALRPGGMPVDQRGLRLHPPARAAERGDPPRAQRDVRLREHRDDGAPVAHAARGLRGHPHRRDGLLRPPGAHGRHPAAAAAGDAATTSSTRSARSGRCAGSGSQTRRATTSGRSCPGYAHLDAIVGTRAAIDVYPLIAKFLDRR